MDAVDQPSPSQRRRMELASSLAGADVPTVTDLPRRVPGETWKDPFGGTTVERDLARVGDRDVEFLLCDGGFTQFLEYAAAKLGASSSRREELAP